MMISLSKQYLRYILTIIIGIISLFSAHVSAEFIGEREDFRDETVYFAMVTRFYDGDPRNNVLCWDNQSAQIADRDPAWRGDFKGLIEKLDYIKALGFTAVWITPVVQNCSGYDYHGYHAMDFSKVDLRYESHKNQGSTEDVTFQSLIDAAHAKGMKIILDIVLNHTGNFGEAGLCRLFERDGNIRNQATAEGSLIPDETKLGADYNNVDGATQYQRRLQWLKNTGGKNLDTHNFWHHIGTQWNWDEPSRWWGQIAGDCVDLNTENQAVSDYLVKCYGKFIEMGVDGFRIDTTGHISRLTLNKSFIPAFLELGEKYKSKRLNECPFYMFGECCARYSEVTYRGQHNLSSYFYTWQSPSDMLEKWNSDPTWWDQQVLMEGCEPVGNMNLCLQEPSTANTSDNVFMKNGKWHEPDYSEASGFNIIDFPMHYNFNNASSAINIAKSGDKYYNDASYNLVYVDSHDYGPQPNDGIRFNGGTDQWAENLSLMFTFRGIPCLYYGSEVEFQKGKKIDNGPNSPLSETGRAYFGHYIEGEITATDFGDFSATGNVASTLNSDLARHISRLNKIRAAVPALRKGQYTFDGCTSNGGFAFKRAYKDSYALVAINGGARFTGVPEGKYTDIVTGSQYTAENGEISITAPKTKGQLRVLVKDWNGGKIGNDGKFIYSESAVSYGKAPVLNDPGANFWFDAEDVVGRPAVLLEPGSTSFKTETLQITASLNEAALSGEITVSGNKRKLSSGQSETFNIGSDMKFGDECTINWTAKGEDGKEYSGKYIYRKVDPNATITIFVISPIVPNFYAWYTATNGKTVEANGSWPGKKLTDTTVIDGVTYYYFTFADSESLNFIFNNNGSKKTTDIKDVREDSYYEWDGANGYRKLFNNDDPSNNHTSTVTIFFDDSKSVWGNVNMYIYGSGSAEELMGSWPGKGMTFDNNSGLYSYTFTTDIDFSKLNVIFNNGNGSQTADNVKIVNRGIYNLNGYTGITGIEEINNQNERLEIYYDLFGNKIQKPGKGIYIRHLNGSSEKIVIR